MRMNQNTYLYSTIEKQNIILEKISHGLKLEQVLETIIFSVEELIDGVICSVFQYDHKDKSLSNGVGPNLPTEYLESINGVKIGPNAGSCGTAAFFGETVIVSDISVDPLWEGYRDLSLSLGLRACWSKPIFSSEKKLLGTFALYYHQPQKPSDHDLDILEKFTYLAGIAIERQRIEEKHQKYELMAENITDLLLIVDPFCVIKYASPSYKTILGYDPLELEGTNGFQYISPEDLEYLQKRFGKFAKTKETDIKEINLIHKNGDIIPFEVTGIPVEGEKNKVENIVMIARDIRERKKIEQALKESEERYRLLVDHSPEAILVHFGNEIVYTNQSGANMIGIDNPAKIIGEPIDRFLHPDYHPVIQERLRRLYTGEAESIEPIEIKIIKSNGEIIDVEVNSQIIKFNGQIGIQSIGRDITDRKKAESKIKFMAYHDNLTQLPNRVSFNQLLQKHFEIAKQENKNIGILFLDVDNFKDINDSIGHSSADYVLKMIAERVRNCLPSQAVLARISGDEFSILMPTINNSAEIEDIANNILDVFTYDFPLEERTIRVTVSIGMSMYPVGGNNPDELMISADLAMYIAKEKGKNTYQVFTNEIKRKFVKRRKLLEDLKYALIQNQFVIHYQPILNVDKNKINSVEALIRWNHPVLGLISPGEFIPLIEENNLIIPIGEWVLRNACQQVKQWQKQGFRGLGLRVNLSVKQFEQENFVDRVTGILHETEINPEFLELEITETILMHDSDRTIRILNQLKTLNVKIALDDFGKGFSSLSYLTHFPFDGLKIDRSFIRKMLIDEKSAAIVKVVMDLAHQLNLKVVAEGVETEEQLGFLVKNRCEEVQGFLINKPLSVQQFEDEYL